MSQARAARSVVPDALAVIGMSVIWPYFRGFFLSLTKAAGIHGTDAYEGAFCAFAVTFALATALALLLGERAGRLVRDGRASLAAALLGALGMALLWLGPLGSAEVAQCVLGSVLNVAFFVFFLLRYAVAFEPLPMGRIVLIGSLSFGLCFASNFLYLLPVAVQAVLCALSPPLVAACAPRLEDDGGAPDTVTETDEGQTSLSPGGSTTALFVLLALFCVTGNFLRGVTNPWFSVSGITYQTLYMSLVNVALVALTAALLHARMPVNRVVYLNWVVYMLLFFAGLLVMVVAPHDQAYVGSNLATVSRVGFTLLMLLFALAPERWSGMGLVRRVALFLLTPEALGALVRYVAVPSYLTRANPEPGSLVTYCGMAIVFVLSAAIVVVLGGLMLRSSEARPAPDPAAAPATDIAALEERAARQLAEHYALTPREADVLRYVARGYALENVAEELGVSINTVRTHTRSIYAKLGVHTRQEVIELVRRELAG